jgi:thymidylate kinase
LNQPIGAALSPRHPILISFSGIDGAGKSTQIANLSSFLRAVGLRVEIVTFWDDVVVLRSLRESAGHKVFRGDKGVGSPQAPIRRRDKNVRSPLMTWVRFGLYWLDAGSFARSVKRARSSGADVVIFDRCLYDELANLNLRSSLTCAFVRAVMRIAPRLHLSFVLDADPDHAHRRKPEYPLDFVRANRTAYLRLSEFLGGINVIPPLPLEQAKNTVVRHVLERFFSRSPESLAAEPPTSPAFPLLQRRRDGQSTRPLAS